MVEFTKFPAMMDPPFNQAEPTLQKRRLPHGSRTLVTHLLALGFAVAVTVLSARNTYFRDIAAPHINTELQAFQFVAKVHDIIVAYSLSEIAIYHLTYNLCLTDGVPLGLLTAPFKLASPLSLFQKEYFRAMPLGKLRRWSRRDWRALHFGTLVLIGTVITAVIAPLSAILFVPELNWWHVAHPFSHEGDGHTGENSGFTYWNTSYGELYPTTLTNSTQNCTGIGANACPWYGVPTLAAWGRDLVRQHVQGNILIGEQGNMARYLTAGNNGNMNKGFAVSSTPMSGLSRNMGTLWLWATRLDLSLSRIGQPVLRLRTKSTDINKQIMRPLVQAQCNPPIDITQNSNIVVTFPTDQLKVGAREIMPSRSLTMMPDIYGYQDQFYENDGEFSPSIDFFDLSQDASRPLLGAVFAASFGGPTHMLPNALGYNFTNTSAALGLFVCSMISHWVPAELSLAPRSSNLVAVENYVDPGFWTLGAHLPDGTRPINMTLDYINVLNAPNSENYFQSHFQYILGSLAPSFPFYDGTWPLHAHVATMLSLQTADALARIQHFAPMFVWYIGNETSRYYSNNLGDLNNAAVYADGHAQNQQIMNNAPEVRDHPELYTEVEWVIQRHGYGWSFGDEWSLGPNVLKRIALLVIMVHVAIVILHWLILLGALLGGRRWQCDDLDSPLSLVLLALQTPERYVSRPSVQHSPDHGATKNRTAYEHVVRIEAGGGKGDLDPPFTEDLGIRGSILTVSAPHDYRRTTTTTIDMATTSPGVVQGLLKKRLFSSHADDVELAEYSPHPMSFGRTYQRL